MPRDSHCRCVAPGLVWIVALLLTLTVSGCSPRKMMIRELTRAVDDALPAMETDTDLDLVEKALPGQIKLLETLLVSDPHNDQLRLLLARFYGLYAFGFVEARVEEGELLETMSRASLSSLRESLKRYYRKGADYARQVLEARHPSCVEGLQRSKTSTVCFAETEPEDVSALFWFGFNLGNYVNQSRNSIRALSKANLAKMVMQHVVTLDPSYYHGGAHLFLMNYYASRPGTMGGNLQSADMHRKVLESLTGDMFLLSDLFYARYFLPQRQARTEFENTLNRVVREASRSDDYPLLNAVAARRATIYLNAVDRLFE
ncbi:hypothetical protein D3OALGB2SA_1908 [Olavius algarvensis associated proteobacterium Delta 3]|nr:hypothetical protein D3OALGB2SA_1908 [Olavius algarvensis associated proteobacterium Delta 3]